MKGLGRFPVALERCVPSRDSSVKSTPSSLPRLAFFYGDFLRTQRSADFVRRVTTHYTVGTLQRLAEHGGPLARRAAVMALGLTAGYEANATVGRALQDTDRAVRLLAENVLPSLWKRQGAEEHRHRLEQIAQLNRSGQFEEADQRAGELIEETPWLAEAWSLRGVARYCLGQFWDAIDDSQRALENNPYHWPAAVGMAYCYLEVGDLYAALESFRRALQIHPSLEPIRLEAARLERSLKGSR